jgi:hypothetical protein
MSNKPIRPFSIEAENILVGLAADIAANENRSHHGEQDYSAAEENEDRYIKQALTALIGLHERDMLRLAKDNAIHGDLSYGTTTIHGEFVPVAAIAFADKVAELEQPLPREEK